MEARRFQAMGGVYMPERYEAKSFPERDWKHLRVVHSRALERYCARVIEECKEVLAHADASAHDRYLRVFRLLRERDRSLEWAFDDMRRSRALERLAAMITLGVVTPDELEGFSPGVRESASGLAGIYSEAD